MTSIQNNLANILNKIREAEIQFARIPNSVKLLAVSKGQSLEKIIAAIHAGQTAFGENYLQEALQKISHVDAEWHFIGPIQSNKTKKIAENFQWVHSVCDKKIAERLNNQRPDISPPLNICIEVNISAEASKSGVMPQEVTSLAEFCLSLPRLQLRGLMAIPAPSDDFSEQRAAFKKLHLIFESLQKNYPQLDTLSMGMSHDFVAAIAEGATMVRIGTAIFGERGA